MTVSCHRQPMTLPSKSSSQNITQNDNPSNNSILQNAEMKLINTLKNCDLEKFSIEIQDYSKLKYPELNHLNLRSVLETLRVKEPKIVLNFLTKLFLPVEDSTSLSFKFLLSSPKDVEFHRKVVGFLYELCINFNAFYPLGKIPSFPSNVTDITKQDCLDGLKNESTKEYKTYYCTRLNAHLVQEFIQTLYQGQTALQGTHFQIDAPSVILEQINQTANYLKQLRQIENRVASLDTEKLFELSAKGAGLNLLLNFFTNQGQTLDYVVEPAIGRVTEAHTSVAITNYAVAPALFAIAGLCFSIWRNGSRSFKTCLDGEKRIHACLLNKLLELYCAQSENPPLSNEFLKKLKKYNPSLPLQAIQNSKLQSAKKGEEEAISLDFDHTILLKTAIRNVKAHNYSKESIDILLEEIEKRDIKIVKSQFLKEKMKLEERGEKNLSSEQRIQNQSLKNVLNEDFCKKLISIYENKKSFPLHEVKKEIEILILEFKAPYSNDASFMPILDHFLKNFIKSVDEKLEFFMHDHVFKTSKGTKINNDKSRGPLFGHILQLYSRTKNPDGKQQLLKFINNRLTFVPETKENTLAKNLYLENKNLLTKTNWADKKVVGRTIEKMITCVLKSQSSQIEKKFILKCMQEDFTKESLTGAAAGLEERRKMIRVEGGAIFGFQGFNVARLVHTSDNSSNIALGGVCWVIALLIGPVLQLLSTTKTTTKKSVLSMLDGAIQYVENSCSTLLLSSQDHPSAEVNYEEKIMSIHAILNKKENKKIIPADSADAKAIFSILKELKQPYLSLVLEHKHERKNYLLLELMDKMQAKEFQELVKTYFSKEDLKEYLQLTEDDSLLQVNDVEKFTRVFSEWVGRVKSSKKHVAFAVVRGMVFLTHLHETVNELPETTEQEQIEKRKQQGVFELTRQKFEETVLNAYEYKNSQLRILTRIKNKYSVFARQAIPRIIAGAIFGTGGTTFAKILQGTMLVGAGIAVAMSGWGLVLGIGSLVILGSIRLVLVAMSDNPELTHKRTTTYSYLTKQLKKLPRFDHPVKPDTLGTTDDFIEFFSTRKTKHKFKFINKNLIEKLKEKSSYNTFKQELEKQLLSMLGPTALNREREIEINLFIDNISSHHKLTEKEKINHIYEKIKTMVRLKAKSDLEKSCIDKSHLLDCFLRFIRVVNDCKLNHLAKLELLMLLHTEMDDNDSAIGQLKKENSYTREKNWFAVHAAAGIFASLGLLASVFLFPLFMAAGLGALLASLGTAFISAAGDSLAGKFTTDAIKEKPYGNTTSSQQAKLLVINMMSALLIASPEISPDLRKKIEVKLKENNSRWPRLRKNETFQIYRDRFSKAVISSARTSTEGNSEHQPLVPNLSAV